MRAGVLLALLPAAAAAAAELPTLVVEAPPELARRADEVRAFDRARLAPAMRLTGLDDPGPPIRVVLAAEGSPAARAAPPWATGYATGAAGLVVLLPARVPRYPDRTLEALVEHEVAHVLVARAAGGGALPRWFSEGVAMAAARAWSLEDRARVALDVLVGGPTPLAEVDATFAAGRGDVAAAYALSQAFVGFLLDRHGPEVTAAILAEVAAGAGFEAAFRRVTGEALAAVEAAFWRRRTFWNRWLPLLTSSTVLWIGVTLLALVAIRRRRQRTAEQLRRWEEEEAWAASEGREEPVN